MRRIRSSTKIFLGFVVLVLVLWFGYNKIQDWVILGQKFTPISPGRINIVGITPDGYKVIVSNDVAQLVETEGGFQASQSDENDNSDSGGSVKKKISVKDMLGVLQGNSKSLSSFVMAMNDITENDLPPVRVIWTKDDVLKALKGDKDLAHRLESDLNMKLDGTPLPALNVKSVENGIVLSIPVSVQVLLNNKPQKVTGDLLLAYKPRMVKAVEKDLAEQNQGTVDETSVAGYYKQEAEKVLAAPRGKEDIRRYLENQFSDETARSYANYPERILKTAFVVVNESYIEDASYTTYAGANGKPLYDLHISLNDEGRRRLWQYSRRRVGDQILLTCNGVAIQQARIQHPLMAGQVTITHMADQGLLDDFISSLKSARNGSVAQR